MSPARDVASMTQQLQSLSVGVQLGTVAVLAVFFVLLARSIRLAEVRMWAAAWVADAVAIGAVFLLGFSLRADVSFWIERLLLTLYVFAKTAYVFGLVAGARHHLRPERELAVSRTQLVAILTVWSVTIGFFTEKLGTVQLVQTLMVGAVLTFGGIWVFRQPRYPRSRWLGAVLLAEGVLFLHYLPALAMAAYGSPYADLGYIRYASFLDAAMELVVALGILAAIEGSTTASLRSLNEELIATRDRLRDLAERDPLTALANRHVLQRDLATRGGTRAAVVFIDVDDFKLINDRLGHAVGDACLRRVAAALRETFRSEDRIFRWGGDEFLVIAPGLAEEAAGQRIEAVRRSLRTVSEDAPVVTISAGIATVGPGTAPEDALRIADERMYADKSRHARSSPSWV